MNSIMYKLKSNNSPYFSVAIFLASFLLVLCGLSIALLVSVTSWSLLTYADKTYRKFQCSYQTCYKEDDQVRLGPSVSVMKQQRLHEIMINHQELVNKLERKLLMTQLALSKHVCPKCGGRRTLNQSSDLIEYFNLLCEYMELQRCC